MDVSITSGGYCGEGGVQTRGKVKNFCFRFPSKNVKERDRTTTLEGKDQVSASNSGQGEKRNHHSVQ